MSYIAYFLLNIRINSFLYYLGVGGLTATQVCVVAAAVAVLGALGVAVALVLRVVVLTTPAFARRGTSWEKKHREACRQGTKWRFKRGQLTFTHSFIVVAAVIVALTVLVALTRETAVCAVATATLTRVQRVWGPTAHAYILIILQCGQDMEHDKATQTDLTAVSLVEQSYQQHHKSQKRHLCSAAACKQGG